MRFAFLLVFFFLNLNASAQNLVPNPSFEDLNFCPFQINQIQAATGWMNWRGTPELFNSCALGSLNVPNTGIGYQMAHTGFSMGGLVGYLNPSGAAGPNYREYIAIQLATPLVIAQKYFISFYTNLADAQGLYVAIDKIGLRFSTSNFTSNTPYPLFDSDHVNCGTILSDTSNWMKCSGTFIADSNYNYICIGNFYHDSLTSTLTISTTPYGGYYYIDDICVSQDSIYTETWTSAIEIDFGVTISLFPNPVNDYLKIKTSIPFSTIRIYNIQGQMILESSELIDNTVDMSNFSNGIYFLYLNSSKKSYKTFFCVNH